MTSPETTPLHETIEALPTALANGVVFALVIAIVIGGTLFVAHAIDEVRAQRRQQHLDRRIDDTYRRGLR